jgi:hypothetical protein
LQEELHQHLSDLWAAVRDLQRGVREGQACVQRQYDKRLEQVGTRPRGRGHEKASLLGPCHRCLCMQCLHRSPLRAGMLVAHACGWVPVCSH